jgi:hypothetical protein
MQGAAGDGHGLATDAHRQFVAVSGPFDVDQAIASQLPLPEHDVVWRRVTYPVLSDEALAESIREKVWSSVDLFSEQSDLLDEAIYRLCKKACS